jgi:23S rRNA (uracil1939-C5)-methyltransferase
VAEVWWRPEGGRLRRLAARQSRDEAGASFVQVNAAVADALRRDVISRITAHAPRTVVDAYAGVGDVAEALAARGVVVTAIERDAAAAAAAARRLAAPSQAVAAAVEDVLAAHLPADVVLLNPPRTGLHADVPAMLAAASPALRAIVYVSCDPATLARDVARLPGWGVARVTCYDMFPQTAHVETVCELVPEAA